MRLKYRILWVDDRKSTFEGLEYDKNIQTYIQELFFEPNLVFCETAEEAKSYISTAKFDVIFSDYNIGDGDSMEKGDDFISHVREQNVNTEILFYSAQNTVPKLDIDRISFFSIPAQDGYSRLFEKMTNLVDLTVEKLRDLTSIRGLVMAETSELDKLMEDIAYSYFVGNGLDEETKKKRERTFNEILDGLDTDYKNNLNNPQKCDYTCSHKIRKSSIDKIITNLSFDSARKARSINKLIEVEQIVLDGLKKTFFEDYLGDIIKTRNDLAHSRSEIKDGIEILITKKVPNEIVFDEAKFKEIRQNILRYESILNEIKKQVS